MRKFLCSLSLIALLPAALSAQVLSGPVKGMVIQSDDSFLEQLQPRDSVLIGDQLRYGFHLKDVQQGTGFMTADFSKGFMPGDSVEVIGPWKADTVKVHGKKGEPRSFDIDFSILITSFEEGSYELRPLSVLRQTAPDRIDTLLFKSRPLEVFTIPVDTTTYQIHDIKGQIRYPVTFREILPYVAVVWGIAFLAVLIWALLSSRRKKVAGESVYKDPPYIVALRKLEQFRDSKFWAQDKQKAYYSGITDALREYIDSRYGIDAPEMTTAELFDSLGHSDVPADLFVELRRLFETADLVKFAKAYASDEENAAAVPLAVRFVTTTYQTPAEPKEGGTE
ncbi:MAG: hypothetical protein IJ205_10140 [Bacteroidales bacterium]|nr:hypothetical protein [Bacteroidales bacterium]